MAAPVTKAAIESEITSVYSQTDWIKEAALLEACGRAAVFLANSSAGILATLDSLEAKVAEDLKARLNTATLVEAQDAGKQHFKAVEQAWTEKNPSPVDPKEQAWKVLQRAQSDTKQQNLKATPGYRKLVTGALHSGLMSATGFKAGVPTFVSFVQTAEFNKNLRDAEHWKDPGVSPDHGELTHQLQWYCLVKQSVDLGGMTHAQLFTALGTVLVKGTVLPGGFNSGSGLGLWEIIFDRGAGPFPDVGNLQMQTSDFRKPDNLLRTLLTSVNRYPLVSSFLAARQKKRIYQLAAAEKNLAKYQMHFKNHDVALTRDNVWTVEYLVRKMYPGQSLEQLPAGHRSNVFETLVRAVL
ncbi:MAG: hypothetical protein H7039_12555 [Bryobacteraceae bacterium]|nr:hypothetical protein [Bryobacteraceae bacterium]